MFKKQVILITDSSNIDRFLQENLHVLGGGIQPPFELVIENVSRSGENAYQVLSKYWGTASHFVVFGKNLCVPYAVQYDPKNVVAHYSHEGVWRYAGKPSNTKKEHCKYFGSRVYALSVPSLVTVTVLQEVAESIEVFFCHHVRKED